MLTATLFFCLLPQAIDGDTLRCGDGSSVRIWGIQAPERSEAGHPASKANLDAFAAGGLVCAAKGTSWSRIVAHCWNGKGQDVGKAQLDGGFAVESCAHSRGYYGGC